MKRHEESTPLGRFLCHTCEHRNHLDFDQEAEFILKWIKNFLITGEYPPEDY